MRLHLLLTLILLISNLLPAQSRIVQQPALLADSSSEFLMPKISPDGSMAAFGGANHTGIYVVNWDGTGLRQLSDRAAAGWDIQWSPDSDALAVRANFWDDGMRNKTSSVLVYDLEGAERNISGEHSSVSTPFWSSRGGTLSWIQNDSAYNSLTLVDTIADFTNITSGNRLMRMAANQRTIDLRPVEGDYLFVDWSPNNSRAAIHVLGKGIYVFDNETRQLFDFGTGEYPSWVDDNYLTCMVVKDDGHQITDADIMLYSYDGRLVENLTAGFSQPALYATANKDGRIVFQTGNGDIYKMAINLTGQSRNNLRQQNIEAE